MNGLAADTWQNDLTSTIGDVLLPLVSKITSIEDLNRVLSSDSEPFQWILVGGGAIIAPEIAYLSRMLGLDDEATMKLLEPHYAAMGFRTAFGKDAIDTQSYFEKITKDSDSFRI